MRRKKNKGGGGGANWMDTYGDMVTLLLCFFVLLYSISSVTEEKWMALVRSFNPSAVQVPTETPGGEGPNADEDDPGVPAEGMTQGEIDQQMEDLYERLKEYVESQGAQTNISVTRGSGYVFISFNQAVFFAGDSYVLRSESFPVLDTICAMLDDTARAIDEVQVLGHTAQEVANSPNDPTVDRFLSSNRATVVTVYLQEHTGIDPGRLVSVGYGQWRPIASNEDRDTRALNRRVEMIVAGKDISNSLGDSVNEYYTLR